MLRFLKKLFQDSPTVEADVAERRLGAIADRLQSAITGSPEEARLLNRAGDLELAAGHRAQALEYYGKSIDAHMELQQFDAAAAICRKVLRLLPDVVRARCTLAWLSLGKGLLDMARDELEEYVGVARKAGSERMAAQQLRLMGTYVRDQNFAQFLAEKLRELGDREGATAVLAQDTSEAPSLQAAGWDPVVFAALLTPDELEQARRKGLDLREKIAQRSEEDFPIYRPPNL
ncbi:MAG: hypothetical protein HY704_14720 [Gemmatimonadetes bacterium]|nr:hypothetical protein [Gemmatimonadota bacterium]